MRLGDMLVGVGAALPPPLAEAIAAGKAVSASLVKDTTYLLTVEETGRRWELVLGPQPAPMQLSDGSSTTHAVSGLREVRSIDLTKHTGESAQSTSPAMIELRRKIAALLAPAPLSFDSIMKALSGTSVGRKEVTEALREISTARGAMHDLNTSGFELVDISEVETRLQPVAAERAVHALIGTPAASAFIPYLSKDVIFSLGDRFELPTAGDENSDDEEASAKPIVAAAKKTQITSMRQIRSIEWDEAELTLDGPLVDEETVAVLTALEEARTNHFGDRLRPVPENPICDDAALQRATRSFNKLAVVVQRVEARLMKFEAACSAARAWISEKGLQHSPKATEEIQQWASAQQPAARAALQLHRRLRHEASLLRREIEDYITFRDVFIPRPV